MHIQPLFKKFYLIFLSFHHMATYLAYEFLQLLSFDVVIGYYYLKITSAVRRYLCVTPNIPHSDNQGQCFLVKKNIDMI